MNSEQRLIEAIIDSRIYQTRILLDLGAKAEFVDEQGYNPLLRACHIEDQRHRTRTILIKLLIENGADVNTKDPQGHHALAYACITSKEDIVSLLLDTSLHNIDLNQRDINGDTPLFHAIRNGNLNILKLLVSCMNKFRIDMHGRNNADMTPYIEAVRLGRTECARVLLEQGGASSSVQVNPFLEGISSKRTAKKALERGVRLKKFENDQQNVNNDFSCHSRTTSGKIASTSCRVIPGASQYQGKKLLKRKYDSGKTIKKNSMQSAEQPLIALNEVDATANVEVPVDPSRMLKNDSYLATNQNTFTMNTIPVTRPRPQTAYVSTREINRRGNSENKSPATTRVFLTDDTTPFPVSRFIPRHRRSKTAPPKNRRPPSAALTETSEGTASWHSHFTLHKTPSVNSLNVLMTLYGEQFSPESSYRKSVKPRIVEDTPAIVGPPDEHDKRSDGRRSSSGSVRSMSGAGRTKFSALLSRTIAFSLTNKKPFSGTKSRT